MAVSQAREGHHYYTGISYHNAAVCALVQGNYVDCVRLGESALAQLESTGVTRFEAQSTHATLYLALSSLDGTIGQGRSWPSRPTRSAKATPMRSLRRRWFSLPSAVSRKRRPSWMRAGDERLRGEQLDCRYDHRAGRGRVPHRSRATACGVQDGRQLEWSVGGGWLRGCTLDVSLTGRPSGESPRCKSFRRRRTDDRPEARARRFEERLPHHPRSRGGRLSIVQSCHYIWGATRSADPA